MKKMRTHINRSSIFVCFVLIFFSSIQWSVAQPLVKETPSIINQKLATEVQSVIDLLDPYSDANKVLQLNRTKEYLETHLNKDPQKNLDKAIVKGFPEEYDSQWVKNLVQGWKISSGFISQQQNDPGTALPEGSRVSKVTYEPIFYLAGPEIPPYIEAFLTLEIQPQNQLEYASIRISNPANPDSYIFLEDVFLLPQQTTNTESYLLDVSAIGPIYDHILCEIGIGTTPMTEEQFVAQQSLLLIPSHCVYFVPSGVPDEVDGLMQASPEVGEEKRFDEDGFRYVRRGDDLPNIDLDGSRFYPQGPFSPPGQGRGHNRARSGQPPSDINACVPAATANSMYWLGKKHPELAKLKNSLRANLDLLKRLMRMNEKRDGVMVKDFIQGKLTFVDSLKLPIKVKYQSVHKAANPDSPLKSEASPHSTATNHGKQGEYPDIKWLMKEIDEDEDVEVNFGYYYPQSDGSLVRRGGHSTVVDGYVTDGNQVRIYLKEDNDQTGPGGTRTIAYAWVLDGKGRPVLSRALGSMKNMPGRRASAGQRLPVDDEEKKKGPRPIKIVETVVSESFDPTVKYPESSSMIPLPWEDIDLTDVTMKPGYPFTATDGGFPWVPVAVGAVGVGTLTYFLTKDEDEEPEPCSFAIVGPTVSSTCGLANGSATVIANPPDDYTYAWSNGATTSSIAEVPAGNYTVTVTQTGTTCINTLSVNITNTNPTFDASFTTTNADCGQNNGSAMVTVTPAGTYTYQWSNGSTEQNQTNLAAGQYSLTVSAGGQCVNTYTVQVDESPFDVSINITTTSSGCGVNDGTATATVDPPGDYVYAWSNGQSGSEATGLAAGDYAVSVSLSGTNCTATATFTVDELPAGHSVSVTTTSSGCGLSDGTATATVDPPGDYTYAWSNGQSGPEASGLAAGDYTVSVSIPGTNCASTATFTVDELPAGHTVNVTTTSSGCGLSDGTATATIDPPGDYTYAWSNGQSGPEATGLAAGQYSVSVSVPGSACLVVQDFIIDQTAGNFTGTITTDDSSCGLADGTATATIDPPGEYTYEWSNGQTSAVADMLSPGTYTLVVTDTNQCSIEISATVGQDTADFITIVSTTPGTCVGEGEITFTLTTPGDGPIVFQADGPNGTTSQTLTPGTYQLSAFFPVSSGSYTMTAYDQTIGADCTESVQTNVADDTPLLIAEHDFYETPGGTPVSGNALDNDVGLDVEMTAVSDEFGGTVTFLPSGDFDFTPEPGFSGEASFVYTVTDACGTTSTAVVTILVAKSICDFDVEFTFTPASCGLEDGAITVEVTEPGTYDYLWSNGDSGPSISALFAGTYSVTIADINLGCDLVFTTDLPENPAEHIDDVFITQPSCGVEGEIQFTVSTNGQNPLVMSVDYPNGSELFFISPGAVLLSDFVSITGGEYSIEIFDAGAGQDCSEILEVTLIPSSSIEIFAEAVVPPTEPTAMDGFAIIVAIVPGTLPYEILLNGNSWGVAIDHTFQVGGLEVGEYTIQLIDAEGCISNVLLIVVPFPGIVMSFGTSVLQTAPDASNEKPAFHETGALWRSTITASVQYMVGKRRHEVLTRYAPPVGGLPGFGEIAYMTDIGRYAVKGLGLALQGGVGSHFEKWDDQSPDHHTLPTYLLLRASGGYTIARRFRLQGSLEMRGWEKLERPRVEIGLSVPFVRNEFRWVK